MPGAARQGMDRAGLGGAITFPVACSVLVNGKPAAHQGSICIPHAPKHKVPVPIVKGSCSVTVEGKPMARAGDVAACKCPINIGSCDVLVGD
jgi:uncharacterized Zn-binding protein involved in type VI secretion